MSPARPETEIEYSRAQPPSGKRFGRLIGLRGDPGESGSGALHPAVLGGGLLGAALLVAAEFTPLLQVHSSASQSVIDTVSTGSHHSYALLPVALLAAVLAYGVWRTRSRWALLAIALLGVLALLLALIGDLPDAQASGLVGSATTHFVNASTSPSTGLYLETLGAIVLLISAVGGLLLEVPDARPDEPQPVSTTRTRSAS